MRHLLLSIAYDGSAYHGWQRQPRQATVQGTIEQRLQQITQQPCLLKGAARTDAGVHARGQLATVRCETRLSCEAIYRGLNALLPPDIVIRAVREVPLELDLRRDVHGKRYRYTIYNAPGLQRPLAGDRLHVRRKLDLQAMAEAAWALVGNHDFAAFRAADCDRLTTRRTLYRCTISADGPVIALDVEGTAFLKNMVRIIAGTLIDVGAGRLSPADVAALLQSGDRTAAGMTAPAHGLCLVEVFLPALQRHHGGTGRGAAPADGGRA